MSGYPYPNDEFDTELDDSHALGIHHVRRSTWSKVWPFLVVVLVCAGLAVAGVTWFKSAGRPGSSSTATAPTAAVTPTGDATSSDPADDETTSESTDAATGEPTDDETTTEPTDEPTTEEPETEEPTVAELDRTATIRVLNATRTQGLAASRVSTLKTAGWTNVTGENFPRGQTAPSQSSVWYASADFADEAQQVAEDLGLSTVTLVESLRGSIAVVLVN